MTDFDLGADAMRRLVIALLQQHVLMLRQKLAEHLDPLMDQLMEVQIAYLMDTILVIKELDPKS